MRFPALDKIHGSKKLAKVKSKNEERETPISKPAFSNSPDRSSQHDGAGSLHITQSNSLYMRHLGKLSALQRACCDWLTSTNCYVYCSHFLSAWGDRMWQFAVALFLIQISPESLQLTAIYGLTTGASILVFAPLIGDWVDKTPRLKAARVTLLLQNLNVIICAVLVCLLVLFHEFAEGLWEGWLLTLWHAGIILVAIFANLSSLGNKISVQRDWIVEVCSRDKDRLATMGAVLRRIDLANKILAPIATGQIMTFTSMLIGAIFIASWNFVSMFVEYFLLWKVYKSVPALASKKKKSSPLEIPEDPEADVIEDAVEAPMTDIPLSDDKESEAHLMNSKNTTTNEKRDAEDSNPGPDTSLTKSTNQNDENNIEKGDNSGQDEKFPAKQTGCCRKGGSCYKMFGGFIILYNGWKTYMKNQVALAGIGLACLYLTVLGFDNITTAYAYSQGLTESTLGILMGSGALVGIVGTFAFTRIRRRVGLERTGLFSFSAEIACLTLCVASIWAPGSPFDPFHWHEKSQSNVSLHSCNMSDTTAPSYLPLPTPSTVMNRNLTSSTDHTAARLQTLTADSNATTPLICPTEFTGHSYFSIALLMAGIISARFGLWISDLTVTQLMLENVIETERGVVNGVQSSLNQLMDMLKFAIVVAAPQPELFGILILISFAAVSTGGIFYASYSRKVRGHLFHPEKLKCITVSNGNIHPPVVANNNSEEVSVAPPAV